jgi:hypothetical protein
METVTGTAVEIGDIPVLNGSEKHTYPMAVLVQFDSIEDLKAAITSTKHVRLQWMVPTGDGE